MFKKFILSFLVCFIAIFAVLSAALYIFLQFAPTASSVPSNMLTNGSDDNASFMSNFMSVPRKTNFLIMGLDKTEALADVILVGSFDSETGEIDMISMPRDTRVTLSDSLYNEMKADGYNPPKSLNLNHIHSYTKEDGAYFTEKFIEEFLGIDINYWVEIDLDAFKYIVDAVGGIWFDVRPEGYHYSDPYQDLYIDIPGGYQLLDGEQAEGLVRYRHDYRMGDIERIEVQQEFMKEFFRQVLDKRTLVTNALDIITAIYNYVNTDFPLSDVPKYLQYADLLNADNFNIVTLPGSTANGVSYYIPDTVAIQELVNEIFYKTNINFDEEPLTSAKIQVLNGSGIAGLAGDTQEILNNDGYDVGNIGNYTDGRIEQTKIVTSRDIDTSELDGYFNNPVHEISDEFSSFYDITIVLGSNEGEKQVASN